MPRQPIDENDPSTYVSCAVCGAKRRRINWNHTESHGLTVAEYRAKYPDASMTSGKTKSIMSDTIKDKWVEDEGYREAHTVEDEFKVKQPVDTSHPDNFVTCEICGKQCKQITYKHCEMHGLTLEEYKCKYPNSSTVSVTTSSKHSEAGELADQGLDSYRDLHEITDDPRTYVECLICGEKFRSLSNHLKSVHSISTDQYKGDWPGASTICKISSDKISTSMSMWIQLNPEEAADRARATGKSRKGKKNRPDHNCKGWQFLWDSFEDDEARGKFIEERYEFQSKHGFSSLRGCTVHYIDRRLKEHTFKSRHELAFAIYLDICKLDWMYEGWAIDYVDEDGKPHKYWPDFVIHYPFIYFEVKPFGMSDEVRTKMDNVEKVIDNLLVIDHDEIHDELNTWLYVKDMNEDEVLDFTRLDLTIRKEAA